MADVRIIQPRRNVMQSAPNAVGQWHVRYMGATKVEVDPVMGWTSSKEIKEQLEMKFDTLEEAKQYCEDKQLSYIVVKPHARKVNIHPYADVLMKNPNL